MTANSNLITLENLPELGRFIRSERRLRGLTLQELGDLTGTGINFVSQMERGKPTVRLDKVLEVLQVLGLQIVTIC